jgi:LPS-assembly protein
MIKLLLIIFFAIFLNAQKVEILGDSTFSDNNISKIKRGLFIKDNIFISADEIVYYRNRKYLIAKDKVYITYDNNSFVVSDLATIYLDTKEMKLYPFFIFDSSSDAWISSIEAKKIDSKYSLTNILSSSCSVDNPDWKIVSSSGDYERKSKWLNLYNPTFYIYDFPVAYLPYMGFSLNKDRKLGLLRPLIGYSVNEGVLFSQPFYIPFSLSSDLEIIPTIRTLRGQGLYSTYRFVNSASSKGSLKLGYFKDFSSYQNEFNLKNQEHYGIVFDYAHEKPFFDKDSLYLDIEYANDVDFFYLDAKNRAFNNTYLSEKTITSVLNYAYNGYSDYFGLYSKYFLDTSKTSNSDTFQILPELHYHKFINSYILDNLISNVDLDIQNYYRTAGEKYIKRNVNIPLTYHFSFFQDYLKLNVNEIIYASDLTTYSNKTEANYYSIDSLIELYTNLSKKIGEDVYHNINFNVSLFFNNQKHQTGESDFINPTETKNSINLKLNQYINSKRISLKHNLSQTFYENDKYSNLFNYLYAKYNNYYIIENNEYSHDLDKVYYNSFTFGYNNKVFDIAWSHIYKYQTSMSYNIASSLKISKNHKLYGYYDYDYETKDINSWYVGVKMSKKCWNYNIKFAQKKLPILTNSGSSNIRQNTIYLEVEFNPIGGLEQYFMYKE